ncbi:MAG: glycoside hydrolase family 127 protein [Kiritimatiellae bacterium]|nr:glycoside hydrolase family 127 protein [Kiritimatiellia bacterium]
MRVVVQALVFSVISSIAFAGGYPYAPAGLNDVKVTGGFWLARIETNRLVTVKTDFRKCEETGRIANFERAARREKGGFKGVPWDDSDVFKVIEGAAYTLAQHPDPELDRYLDNLIAQIAGAQEQDGYLYTARTLGYKAPMMGPKPFSRNRDACELYNVGHLYEAAVAHYEVTGKRTLLDVATRNADLVAKTFGLGEGQSCETSGHEEIEIGLCRLYQATGDAKYLKLAQHFIDMRGRRDLRPVWGAAYQDHKPVLEQKEALGHAVRAAYLYAGMADVAALTGNTAYVDAIDALWSNVVSRKLHLNGGIGARRHVKYRDPALGSAHEAFGDEYDLQNLDAYLETCAAIGNALWNERMFLLHGDAKYIDVMERTLYNGLISGVSIGGDEFFYPNPLASKGGYKRSKWFGCSCCPVNVVRFIPQIGRFAYAAKDDSAYVNLFVESEAKLRLAGGEVKLVQKTAYPWNGYVRIVVTPGRAGSPLPAAAVAGRPPYLRFTLNIRVPGWCVGRPVPSDLYEQVVPGTLDDFRVTVNGAAVKVAPVKGYCVISREWKTGDVVEISMNMPARRIKANDKVAADRGRYAVERGPIVFCAEGIDNGGKAFNACLPLSTVFTEGEIEIASTRMVSLVGGGLTLVPYFAWCHRGAGEMQTWFAESTEATEFRIRLKCRPKRSAGIVEIRTR